MNNKPIIIVVNGHPRSGKDTFCDFADFDYNTEHYSTVSTVKYLADIMGWDGEKTPNNRNMLSALKDFYTDWFDGPFNEITSIIKESCGEDPNWNPNYDFIFLHIREPKEIGRIREWCANNDVIFYSILIDRKGNNTDHNNHADADVANYPYDKFIHNNGTLDEFEDIAVKTFDELFTEHNGEEEDHNG